MAIAWSAAGTAVTGNGASPNLAPTAPASDANSFNVLMIGWKSSSIAEPSVSTTTGTWVRVGVADSAADVATGTDTGSTTTLVYYSLGTAPTGTSVQFTGTVGACQAVIFNASKASNEGWVYAYSAGSDESNGANYSATTTTNFLTVANDLCVTCTTTNGDLGTVSVPTLTATGITFGTVTARIESASTTGDDSRIKVESTPTNSGTQSGNAVYGHTNASSAQGTTLILRLRVLANPTLDVVPIDEFAETAGYQVTASGLTPFTQFQITVTESSDVRDLRGAFFQIVPGSSFVGDDFEFEFGTTAGYASPIPLYSLLVYSENQLVATVTDSPAQSPYDEWVANLASNSFSVGVGPKTYLSIPRTPSLNIPVMIQEFNAYTRAGRLLSKSTVLGRPNPVVSVDVTNGRTGNFTLLVPHADMNSSQYVPTNIREHIDVLEGGHVYMLRNVSPYTIGIEDFYFVVDNIGVNRVNRYNDMTSQFNIPIMVIEVEWTEVDAPPATDEVSLITWQDILDSYPSWQAVLDANISWLDVLQNG